MNQFLTAFLTGESFLFCILLFFHPLKQNAKANRWLSLSAFVMGTAFLAGYIDESGLSDSYRIVLKLIISLQFLLGPAIYISILYFVNPTARFKIRYWLHFLPFLTFAFFENVVYFPEQSISTITIFIIGSVSVFIRDLLPFQILGYLIASLIALSKHQENLRLITSTTGKVDLNWLKLFLAVAVLPILFWINDALSINQFIAITSPYIYVVSILPLAYYAMKQSSVFPFEAEVLDEISELINKPSAKSPGSQPEDPAKQETKQKRLTENHESELTKRLDRLMTEEQLYLENELNLAMVAERLGASIHDTSYLINEIKGNNFYNFVNRFRVEEAKKLLMSSKIVKLNMLGIAFGSGFNSKTAFNTAFKKWTGVSPSEFAKKHKKH